MQEKSSIWPPRWTYIAFIIGASVIGVRALLDSRFANSALLYVAIPFLVSFLLFQFTPRVERSSPWRRYIGHLRDATIVMLATSAFLFEGFICVLFFMPIYYVGVTIGFIYDLVATRRRNKNKGKVQVAVIPLMIAVLALEGVAPSTSFERRNSISRTVIVDATIDELKQNMAAPIAFRERRHLLLSVFPLPVNVEAGSLEVGDIHTLEFVYKRWFFTNVHRGEFKLRLDEVGKYQIRTTVQENSAYFSKYLDIKGTEVKFEPLQHGQTQVTLTIHYDRLLDPAWYFGPLQKMAISQSADYLIDTVITRSDPGG